MIETLRYVAFSTDPAGGNPAGVVLEAELADTAGMQQLAARIGYSETAFLAPVGADFVDPDAPVTPLDARHFAVRYFSPLAEVPFCGHATIAASVALADRDGPGTIVLHTVAGLVSVQTRRVEAGTEATLTSVQPQLSEAPPRLVEEVLAALRWAPSDLDAQLPPLVAFAGARHLVLAARTRERLSRLDYAFDELAGLMRAADLTTVVLGWREDALRYHVRNPFPVGGVVEDPATGAAAAAFGAYLRELGLVRPPARITLHQGDDLGRPSLLLVDLVDGDDRVRVTGTAVPID